MIHQFAELGAFYQQQEGIGATGDRLSQFAQDPAQKFRTNTVLLLVFSDSGFNEVQVEHYDAGRKLLYLYRAGPANGWDATPTTGLHPVKRGNEAEFDEAVRKKLVRLSKSVGDAKENTPDQVEWERRALAAIYDQLQSAGRQNNGNDELLTRILTCIKSCHAPDSKLGAILSVAWQNSSGEIEHVGNFAAFRQALTRQGENAASSKKGIKGEVKGQGQCCICGRSNTAVSGLLQIPNFKIYSLDKPGSVSGGFSAIDAWRNFPACRECCEQVDFAGERVKKNLSFDYYSSFKYLFLPMPLRPQSTGGISQRKLALG